MKHTIFALFLTTTIFFTFGSISASAHVVVKPAQAGIGAFQTFTIGVPNEKDIATIGLRLMIPAGLKYVTPNVKNGWKINVKKEGTGESANITEISWTEGIIPVGQRDEFLFSAQVPSTETTLQWNAYQTYANRTIVSWDQDPKITKGDAITATPYSKTQIINDLKQSQPVDAQSSTTQTKNIDKSIPYIALILSIVSLGLSLRKRS